MSSVKRYMDFVDSVRYLDNILEKLARIDYEVFLINDTYSNYGIRVRTVITENLFNLFINNDFSETGIQNYYSQIAKKAAISRPNIADPHHRAVCLLSYNEPFYLGEDIERYCEYLEELVTGLCNYLYEDATYNEHSHYSLIKQALRAEYRLKKALDFVIERKYNTSHISKLKELGTYALKEFKKEKIKPKLKGLFLACDEVETLDYYYPEKLIINPSLQWEEPPTQNEKNEILELNNVITESCIKKAKDLDLTATDLHCTYEVNIS